MALVDVLPNGLPDPTMPAPSRVEVIECVGEWTTFGLSYGLSIENQDAPLLIESRIDAEAELVLRVKDGLGYAVLVRGLVTGQNFKLLTGGDDSGLQVMGAEVSVALAREHKLRSWPTITDSAAVIQILGEHTLTPDVDLPSTVTHTEDKNSLLQRGSDWQFIQQLAARNGCWIWITYDPLLMLPTVHVKRPPIDTPSAADLCVSGASRNVEEVQIYWDIERTVSADAMHIDVRSLADMEGSTPRSPLTGLADKNLSDIVRSVRKRQLSVAVDDAGDLMVRSEAALIAQDWFVEATLKVRYSVIQKVIRSHSVVTLHGAGSRHSGKYLVKKVIHQIDQDEHWMMLELARNGWNRS